MLHHYVQDVSEKRVPGPVHRNRFSAYPFPIFSLSISTELSREFEHALASLHIMLKSNHHSSSSSSSDWWVAVEVSYLCDWREGGRHSRWELLPQAAALLRARRERQGADGSWSSPGRGGHAPCRRAVEWGKPQRRMDGRVAQRGRQT